MAVPNHNIMMTMSVYVFIVLLVLVRRYEIHTLTLVLPVLRPMSLFVKSATYLLRVLSVLACDRAMTLY